MCEPTTIALAGLAISAASTATGFIGAQQQADAQEEYNAFQQEQTRLNAEAAYANDFNAEQARLSQEAAADSREIQEAQIDAAKARATARTAAGEAGVSGLSVDALIADFNRSEARFRDATRQQQEFDTLASRDRLRQADARKQSRINSAVPQPVQRPSFLGAALRIGGAGVSAAGELESEGFFD